MRKAYKLLLSVTCFASLSVYAQNAPARDSDTSIEAIKKQIIELKKVYTADYPGILELEAELQQLRRGVRAPMSKNAVQGTQIEVVQAQLAELRKIYTDDYPEILRLQLQLKKLRNSAEK